MSEPPRTSPSEVSLTLEPVAVAAGHLARQIRSWFPVAGASWLHKVHDPGVTSHVYNAVLGLERTLSAVPQPLRWRGVWQDIYDSLEAIRSCHAAVLQHYKWTDCIKGSVCPWWVKREKGKAKAGPWRWPKVPPISSALLDQLQRSADALASLLRDFVARLKEPPAEGWEWGPDHFRCGPNEFQLRRPVLLRLLRAFVEAKDNILSNTEVDRACDPQGYVVRPDQRVSELNRQLRRLWQVADNPIISCGQGSKAHKIVVPAKVFSVLRPFVAPA
jgi:hypothetical protein